jgi:hypothetical protein
MARLPRSRGQRRAAGTPAAGAPGQELERITPPTYDMSTARHDQDRADIAELIARLQPGALNANSREVLNNLINARTDALLAELDAARDERQAVVDSLVAQAAEQVARYKPQFEADLARVAQTSSALATAYEALTGQSADEFSTPRPRRAGEYPIESTLGPIDLSDDSLADADDPTEYRGYRDAR